MYVVVTTKFAESLELANRDKIGGHFLVGFFLPSERFYIHDNANGMAAAEAICSYLNGGAKS